MTLYANNQQKATSLVIPASLFAVVLAFLAFSKYHHQEACITD